MPGPGRPPMRGGPKVKDLKGTALRLLSYMKEYWLNLVIVVIAIIGSAFTTVKASLFLETLIDDHITPMLSSGSRDYSGLAHALLIMVCIYMAGTLCTWLYNFLMVSVSQGVQNKIRDEMFSHMQKLPLRYFDSKTHGDIMSHYTNDTDTLRQMLSMSIPQVLSSLISITVVFINMLLQSVYLTIFVIITVLLMSIVMAKIGGKSGGYFIRQQQSIGKVNGFIEEMIDGQRVVQVFNHEEIAKYEFDKLNNELCENATNANRFANILMPIMMNLGNLQFALIAVFGAFLTVSGVSVLTVGTLVAFLQLSKSFTNPISMVSQQINSVVMAMAGAERIFELLDEKPETDDGYVTLVNAEYQDGTLVESGRRTGIWAWKHPHENGTTTLTPMMGDVRFFGVDFGYVPEKVVLHDISLYAKPGQKIAFVGATGAGKTTITNLINRFYDIADGKIRYDEININKIKKADLRHSLGVVLQDVNLFTGTIMDNIRYGKLDATDEECIAAAKLANAHGFIEMLPNGYQTVLEGDGSGLSQGQRQLISIARAAVADPPVMILDEATSSIDTRTEALVQKGMDRLMNGRTVFVIAHRLSTVQNSDVIMVLDHGNIIEKGNHEALIAQRGNYYRLYTGAFELE